MLNLIFKWRLFIMFFYSRLSQRCRFLLYFCYTWDNVQCFMASLRMSAVYEWEEMWIMFTGTHTVLLDTEFSFCLLVLSAPVTSPPWSLLASVSCLFLSHFLCHYITIFIIILPNSFSFVCVLYETLHNAILNISPYLHFYPLKIIFYSWIFFIDSGLDSILYVNQL